MIALRIFVVFILLKAVKNDELDTINYQNCYKTKETRKSYFYYWNEISPPNEYYKNYCFKLNILNELYCKNITLVDSYIKNQCIFNEFFNKNSIIYSKSCLTCLKNYEKIHNDTRYELVLLGDCGNLTNHIVIVQHWSEWNEKDQYGNYNGNFIFQMEIPVTTKNLIMLFNDNGKLAGHNFFVTLKMQYVMYYNMSSDVKRSAFVIALIVIVCVFVILLICWILIATLKG